MDRSFSGIYAHFASVLWPTVNRFELHAVEMELENKGQSCEHTQRLFQRHNHPSTRSDRCASSGRRNRRLISANGSCAIRFQLVQEPKKISARTQQNEAYSNGPFKTRLLAVLVLMGTFPDRPCVRASKCWVSVLPSSAVVINTSAHANHGRKE